MPKLSEVTGLTEFVIELKDEQKLPWESETKANIRAEVVKKFPGSMKPNGSIIPLRDLYRQAKLATEKAVVSGGKTVEAINPKGRGGKERVWAARRSGMGLTLLQTATGLSAAEVRAILKEAPDADQLLSGRIYGQNEDGSVNWSPGAAVVHKAKQGETIDLTSDLDLDTEDEDEQEDEPTPAPAPRRRRRRTQA